MPVDYISLEYMVKETKKRKINFSHTQTNTKLVRKALFLLLLQQIMEYKGLLICSFQCRADVRRKKNIFMKKKTRKKYYGTRAAKETRTCSTERREKNLVFDCS